jgi:hypothetical protein
MGWPNLAPVVYFRLLLVGCMEGIDMTANMALFPRLLQLPIPRGMDLLLTPAEHVLRRDVANALFR